MGVPAGVFQDVALDDRRGDAVAVAHADEGAVELVQAGQAAHFVQQFGFAQRFGQVKATRHADGLGHRLVDEFIERSHAHLGDHLADGGGFGADVAVFKVISGS